MLDSLLNESCQFAVSQPQKAIDILESRNIFAPGTLTPESIERCRINYLSTGEAKESILDFLRLIEQYEPKAMGGKLPDNGFISENDEKGLISCVSVCLLLLIWQLIASSMDQPELIPSVPELIKALFQLFGTDTFYKSISATILRGISGIILSLGAAVMTAFLFARYELLYELFRPLLTIMRSVPVISFILLALIFLDPEGIPLIIAFLTMFPLLTENLTKGIISLRPGLSLMAAQFKINRKNKLIHIYYPQLKPFLFSGLALLPDSAGVLLLWAKYFHNAPSVSAGK